MSNKGFTLIEILVAMGLLAVLSGITIAAINPGRLFAQGRNTQRRADLSSILSAITQNMVEHQGKFDCKTPIPKTKMAIASIGADLHDCLVPSYLPELPTDPSTGQAFKDGRYNTEYEIAQDDTNGRISLKSPRAELEQTIEIVR